MEPDDDSLKRVSLAQQLSSMWDSQVKNRRTVGEVIVPCHIADPRNMNRQPTLTFFLELSDADPPATPLVQVEEARSFPRVTRSHPDVPQSRHYQINVRGLQSFKIWQGPDVENIKLRSR
jgi:hypothetical protein